MQRREQQRRAVGGGASGYGGGSPSYSALPQQTHFPSPALPTNTNRAPVSSGKAAFKSSGMKLGSKKTKQAELLDALGGELVGEEVSSVPQTPADSSVPRPVLGARSGRGNIPMVEPKE